MEIKKKMLSSGIQITALLTAIGMRMQYPSQRSKCKRVYKYSIVTKGVVRVPIKQMLMKKGHCLSKKCNYPTQSRKMKSWHNASSNEKIIQVLQKGTEEPESIKNMIIGQSEKNVNLTLKTLTYLNITLIQAPHFLQFSRQNCN